MGQFVDTINALFLSKHPCRSWRFKFGVRSLPSVLQEGRLQSCHLSGRNLAEDQHFRSEQGLKLSWLKQKKLKKQLQNIDIATWTCTFLHSILSNPVCLYHFRTFLVVRWKICQTQCLRSSFLRDGQLFFRVLNTNRNNPLDLIYSCNIWEVK